MAPGRNAPCPCGSAKKYKNCCGAGPRPRSQTAQLDRVGPSSGAGQRVVNEHLSGQPQYEVTRTTAGGTPVFDDETSDQLSRSGVRFLQTEEEHHAFAICDGAEAGSLETVRKWLEKGVPVDARNSAQATPLLRACWFGRAEVAKLLLESGADPNAKQANGYTPLICAMVATNAQVKHELIALLCRHGADASACDNNGMTPLMVAESMGDAFAQNFLAQHLLSQGKASPAPAPVVVCDVKGHPLTLPPTPSGAAIVPSLLTLSAKPKASHTVKVELFRLGMLELKITNPLGPQQASAVPDPEDGASGTAQHLPPPSELTVPFTCFHLARFSTLSEDIAAALRLPVLGSAWCKCSSLYSTQGDRIDSAFRAKGCKKSLVLARLELAGRSWTSVCCIMARSSLPRQDCFSLPNFLAAPDLLLLLDAGVIERGPSCKLSLQSHFGEGRTWGLDHEYDYDQLWDQPAVKALLSPQAMQAFVEQRYMSGSLERACGLASEAQGYAATVRVDPTWNGPFLVSQGTYEAAAAEGRVALGPNITMQLPGPGAAPLVPATPQQLGDDPPRSVPDREYQTHWKQTVLPHVTKVFINTPQRLEEECRAVRSSCAACGKRREGVAGGGGDGNLLKLKSCSQCSLAMYCSAQCQNGHWGKHKLLCGKYKGLNASEA